MVRTESAVPGAGRPARTRLSRRRRRLGNALQACAHQFGSATLHNAGKTAGSPDAEPRAVAGAYMEFARANPALYEAMFTLTADLTFAQPDTPTPVHASFVELCKALAPLAGDRDLETFTEVVWSALHGLATLSQAGRLRPDFYDERLVMIIDQLGTGRG